MSIYAIGDLHLSFSGEKPMDIFGYNWENHAEKIKENWTSKVNKEDTVILPGDFSWATYLEDTYKDFEFLNSLPGKKILSKGNHDYWWGTLTSMRKFLKENNFQNIDFLFNNSYFVENKIITGTRGWINSWKSEENFKILKVNYKLKILLKKKEVPKEIDFIDTMKSYNIKKCYYAHLHGESHKDAIEKNIDGIDYKLVSSDYLKFDLLKID